MKVNVLNELLGKPEYQTFKAFLENKRSEVQKPMIYSEMKSDRLMNFQEGLQRYNAYMEQIKNENDLDIENVVGS